MTKELIILTAAGWKGSGVGVKAPPGPKICYPLKGCPESLLPIGNGETVLSRLVRQFQENSFQDFAIGVGKPGYGFPGNRSPWTGERISYIAQFGEIVFMPDPYNHTHWHTAATVLERCGKDYAASLILLADFVLTDQFVKLIAAMPRPSELLERVLGSSMFWLDKRGSDAFIKAAWRDWGNKSRRDGHFRVQSKAAMVAALREAGVPLLNIQSILACEGFDWRDVDTAASYERILEWLKEARL